MITKPTNTGVGPSKLIVETIGQKNPPPARPQRTLPNMLPKTHERSSGKELKVEDFVMVEIEDLGPSTPRISESLNINTSENFIDKIIKLVKGAIEKIRSSLKNKKELTKLQTEAPHSHEDTIPSAEKPIETPPAKQPSVVDQPTKTRVVEAKPEKLTPEQKKANDKSIFVLKEFAETEHTFYSNHEKQLKIFGEILPHIKNEKAKQALEEYLLDLKKENPHFKRFHDELIRINTEVSDIDEKRTRIANLIKNNEGYFQSLLKFNMKYPRFYHFSIVYQNAIDNYINKIAEKHEISLDTLYVFMANAGGIIYVQRLPRIQTFMNELRKASYGDKQKLLISAERKVILEAVKINEAKRISEWPDIYEILSGKETNDQVNSILYSSPNNKSFKEIFPIIKKKEMELTLYGIVKNKQQPEDRLKDESTFISEKLKDPQVLIDIAVITSTIELAKLKIALAEQKENKAEANVTKKLETQISKMTEDILFLRGFEKNTDKIIRDLQRLQKKEIKNKLTTKEINIGIKKIKKHLESGKIALPHEKLNPEKIGKIKTLIASIEEKQLNKLKGLLQAKETAREAKRKAKETAKAGKKK